MIYIVYHDGQIHPNSTNLLSIKVLDEDKRYQMVNGVLLVLFPTLNDGCWVRQTASLIVHLSVLDTSRLKPQTVFCQGLNFPLDHQNLSLLQAGSESSVEVIQKMWKKERKFYEGVCMCLYDSQDAISVVSLLCSLYRWLRTFSFPHFLSHAHTQTHVHTDL